jgi:hypothetical protein
MRNILQRLVRRWRDPFLINRDWDEFKAMTDDEMRLEYDRLLTARPMSDRFRRLCQFISLRWVNAPNDEGSSKCAIAKCSLLDRLVGLPVGSR